MRGYDREEVEEYDDYEEYGDQQEEESEEEEYEEEEERKPTAEELEYLEYRERIKQQIRKRRQKESSSAHTRSHDRKELPSDNFGSFFGPSQTFISQRVIQESKSLLENPHLAARLSNSNNNNNRSASGATGSKHPVHRQTKVKKELQTKVQKLKDVRDYSFLLSDDAEPPAPKQHPAQRNIPRPNSDGRSAQMPQRTKQPSVNGKSIQGSGKIIQGSREERESISVNSHVQSKAGSHKAVPAIGKSNSVSADPRRQNSANTKIVQGRPSGSKPLPSKTSASPLERRLTAPGAKGVVPQKPQPSRPQSSAFKKPVEQQKGLQNTNKSKMVQTRPMASSKPQVNQPLKRVSSQPSLQDSQPKKKPFRQYSDEEDDDEKALIMIRRMFNTSRFAGRDDDDSDMEANFNDILKEERRSSKIARKEDEEQLRLIEEEERRERMRRLVKKQKQ